MLSHRWGQQLFGMWLLQVCRLKAACQGLNKSKERRYHFDQALEETAQNLEAMGLLKGSNGSNAWQHWIQVQNVTEVQKLNSWKFRLPVYPVHPSVKLTPAIRSMSEQRAFWSLALQPELICLKVVQSWIFFFCSWCGVDVEVIQGFNATVFAYGATSAGKTHTMLGYPGEPGIMLLTLRDLFSEVANQKSSLHFEHLGLNL